MIWVFPSLSQNGCSGSACYHTAGGRTFKFSQAKHSQETARDLQSVGPASYQSSSDTGCLAILTVARRHIKSLITLCGRSPSRFRWVEFMSLHRCQNQKLWENWQVVFFDSSTIPESSRRPNKKVSKCPPNKQSEDFFQFYPLAESDTSRSRSNFLVQKFCPWNLARDIQAQNVAPKWNFAHLQIIPFAVSGDLLKIVVTVLQMPSAIGNIPIYELKQLSFSRHFGFFTGQRLSSRNKSISSSRSVYKKSCQHKNVWTRCVRLWRVTL